MKTGEQYLQARARLEKLISLRRIKNAVNKGWFAAEPFIEHQRAPEVNQYGLSALQSLLGNKCAPLTKRETMQLMGRPGPISQRMMEFYASTEADVNTPTVPWPNPDDTPAVQQMLWEQIKDRGGRGSSAPPTTRRSGGSVPPMASGNDADYPYVDV